VATGQEACSVAMAVSDFLSSRPGLGLTIDNFPILASDISVDALATAREGRVFDPGTQSGNVRRTAGAGTSDRNNGAWVVDPSPSVA